MGDAEKRPEQTAHLAPGTDPARRPPVESAQDERGWFVVRAVLLAVWLVLIVGAVLFGGRSATLTDLMLAVQDGRVDEVTLVGGLPAGPGVTGQARQEARWREGVVLRVAEYQVVRPDSGFDDGSAGLTTDDDGRALEETSEDVAAQLVLLDPDVEVRVEPWPEGWAEFFNWRAPSWVAPLVLGAWLGPLLLLVAGPQPWRATRWAWFWLLQPPVGTVAFLLLSGRLPWGRRTAPDGARLTGGWAFLLSLVIGSLLGSTYWGMR